MSSHTANPTEAEAPVRLSCRVAPRIKRRAEEAAALLGQSITDFTEAAIAEKAEAVLERLTRLKVSERDFERFLTAINAPKAPTPRLRDAMREYERQRAEEPEGDW